MRDESLVLSKSLKDYSLVKFSFLIPSVSILAVSPSVVSIEIMFFFIQEETDINVFLKGDSNVFFLCFLICKKKNYDTKNLIYMWTSEYLNIMF